VVVRAFVWLGLLEGALALFAYLLGYWTHGWRPGEPFEPSGAIYAQATTLTYAAIVMAQVGNALASRTRRISLLQIGLLTNRALLVGLLASIVLMLALIYVPPLANVFGFVSPTLGQWAVLLTFPFIVLSAEEGRKWWRRRHRRTDRIVSLGRRHIRSRAIYDKPPTT
jgi:magnesium-transporting ATPase (P-type)